MNVIVMYKARLDQHIPAWNWEQLKTARVSGLPPFTRLAGAAGFSERSSIEFLHFVTYCLDATKSELHQQD